MPSGNPSNGKPNKGWFKKGQKGKDCINWKSGKWEHVRGYIYILKPKHPFSGKKGYILEHRLVMEKHIGRYLMPKEVVHHINGNTSDNHLKNLRLFKNQKDHLSFHSII